MHGYASGLFKNTDSTVNQRWPSIGYGLVQWLRMGDRELKTWVKDQMHSLVQYSDGIVANYLISKARECRDKGSGVSAFVSSLGQFDIPTSGPAVQAFAQGLFSRLPQPGGSKSAYKQQEQQAKSLLKRNRAYGLLDDEEDPPEPPKQAPAATAAAAAAPGQPRPSSGDKGDKFRKHIRKSGRDGDAEDEDDTTVVPAHKRHKRKWEEEEEGVATGSRGRSEAEEEAARLEAQREEDQREKEEFEARWGSCSRLAFSARCCPVLQLSPCNSYGAQEVMWNMEIWLHRIVGSIPHGMHPKEMTEECPGMG